MRVIEKIEVSKLKYGCVVVTQNFLFNYSLFKIILNPSKKVEFSSENQKDMSVDGNYKVDSWETRGNTFIYSLGRIFHNSPISMELFLQNEEAICGRS